MLPFNKLDISFDVAGLNGWLMDCDLWGEYPQRCVEGSPHSEVADIWVRFNDPEECIRTGDWASFIGEHESKWLKDVPYVKDIAGTLMQHLDGSRLGGILITKLGPNGKISPHIDQGWHASFYDKYFVAINNPKGAKFCFDDGFFEPENGEVYAFRNDVTHWVENNSNESRIAMVICIKQDKLSEEGLCLGE